MLGIEGQILFIWQKSLTLRRRLEITLSQFRQLEQPNVLLRLGWYRTQFRWQMPCVPFADDSLTWFGRWKAANMGIKTQFIEVLQDPEA